MYCPSCGTELTQELVYCNRCGANLKQVSNPSRVPTKLVGAAWAMSLGVVAVTLGGFGMIFGLVMALINRGVNVSTGGMVLLLVSLLIIMAVDWALIRQLSRILELPGASGTGSEARQTKLEEKFVPQISAPQQPLSSVIDNTTRTFEPIKRER